MLIELPGYLAQGGTVERDWLSLGIDVVAASGTLLALVVALVAYRAAKNAGRVAFELEILRELQNRIEEPGILPKLLANPNRACVEKGISARVALIRRRDELLVWSEMCREKDPRVFSEFLHRHYAVEETPQDQLRVELTMELLLAIDMRTRGRLRRRAV
ncbi:hypothetical protein [Micromonospora sp. NPDC048839]|uniref:hypothetical protein n=1 Tax=Micromonospora sp. NPDC048839 TaxID=3155641 RepID=UPI003400074D